jgi:hypothetical protein
VTEAEWLACSAGDQMLSLVVKRTSQRQWRLLRCACVRRLGSLLSDERCWKALDAVEQDADRPVGKTRLQAAQALAAKAVRTAEDVRLAVEATGERGQGASRTCAREAAAQAAEEAANGQGGAPSLGWGPWVTLAEALHPSAGNAGAAIAAEDRVHCELIREVVGNPFRPVALDLALRTAIVVSLATAAYEQRPLPGGGLDPARLCVLADALEEVGAAEEVVTHLRGPGPHVRGCWALDLCLGKSCCG